MHITGPICQETSFLTFSLKVNTQGGFYQIRAWAEPGIETSQGAPGILETGKCG